MGLMVVVVDGSHRLAGDVVVVDLANRWLAHLEAWDFSSRTVRAYAFDVLNFARFLDHSGIELREVVATDVFDWLAWQRQPLPSAGRPRPLPESLPTDEVAVFLADLETHRDRAVVMLMLLGGLRASEVRSLRLADVDLGMRQVTVTGKGNKQRTVPVDRAFFTELGSYLRVERPAGLCTPECFVVLRGPTTGQAMTEAGLRRVFRNTTPLHTSLNSVPPIEWEQQYRQAS